MRSYGTIPTDFWLDDMGSDIKGNAAAMVLCCYLMSSPHSNMIGIYRLPIEYVKVDTGLAEEIIRDALATLRAAQWAFYDEGAKTVWIPTFAAVQVAKELKPKDKRILSIQREVEKATHEEFKKLFLERYAEAYHLSPFEAPPEGDGGGIEGASKGQGRAIEGPSFVSEHTQRGATGSKTVDNRGSSKGHRRDIVPDLDTGLDRGVKRGPGREEERRPPVGKTAEWIENWPRQMAGKKQA